MKKIFIILATTIATVTVSAQELISAEDSKILGQWEKPNGYSGSERYAVDQYREVADNIVGYQNEDGGWAKNLDMMSKADPQTVIMALKPFQRKSTLDNVNIYPQVDYLAVVYTLTGEGKYADAARRGIGYILNTQYPNGGWRGWDVDAITFNDDVIFGVLSTWLDILEGQACYAWLDEAVRERIKNSFDRGIELILKCQYVQNGIKTVWGQQHDHVTLMPCKARSYELPSLTAGESSNLVMLLMRIKKPSPEIIDAVKCAVAWFEKVKITGKKIVMIQVPEGLAEDPKIKRDRIMVDDPEAAPIWSRYYELEDNTPFLCRRDGVKVYTLAEMPAERRVGYNWFSNWPEKVLKKYPKWLAQIEKNAAKAAAPKTK